MRLIINALGVLCLLTSTFAWSSSCLEIQNKIYSDIKKYPDNIDKQQLDWMNINWLTQELGQARDSELPNHQKQYDWTCGNSVNPTLTAVVDQNGKMLNLTGQYNSDAGSGMFNAVIVKPLPTKVERPELTAAAIACQDQIKQIVGDISRYKLDSKTPSKKNDLPWMNLTFLKDKLGRVNSTNVNDVMYMWNTFSLELLANGTTGTINQSSNKVDVNNLADAMKLFGKPNEQRVADLNKYVWHCPATSSTLSLIADKQGVIMSVSALACNDSDCSAKMATLNKSNIELIFDQRAILKFDQVLDQVIDSQLQDYNNHFKTSFETNVEMKNDVVIKLRNYFKNLRSCTPGSYDVAVPLLAKMDYATHVIIGTQNGLCIVDSASVSKGAMIEKKCQYTATALPLFSEKALMDLVKGNLLTDDLKAVEDVNTTQCKTFMNGNLVK